MIGQRFHVKIGWISTITSSIECKHGVFDAAAFGENMDHVMEDWECGILEGREHNASGLQLSWVEEAVIGTN
jgi:hypothetical protein